MDFVLVIMVLDVFVKEIMVVFVVVMVHMPAVVVVEELALICHAILR